MTDKWTDGDYPTKAALKRIKEWSYKDITGCFSFVLDIWHWSEWAAAGTPDEVLRPAESEVIHAEGDRKYLRLATGGWSGNEDIVGAINGNKTIRALCWKLSARGGLHIYEYPREK